MLIRAGDEDTICALSTPPGVGGIAVIRVSGPKALALTRKLAGFVPEHPESHHIYYGIIQSVLSGDALDEVLVSFFAEGRSFTGEETTEISCHGGTVITATVLKELLGAGCRLATRGEFTYRAFMNGKLDLVQAESVLSLIESQSKQSAKVALRQLQGHLSTDFHRIEDDLVWILAHLEASIDFSTEGIDLLPSEQLLKRATALLDVVSRLIGSYAQGRLLREGIEVALIGRPNAGKSSLLNAFLGEERAIVTPHAGTTRDTVEGKLSIAGVPVTFIDTAGLRETENEIEKIGIERSRLAMDKADFIFSVIDLGSDHLMAEIGELARENGPKTYFLLNKIDLKAAENQRKIAVSELKNLGIADDRVFAVSALNRTGLAEVEEILAKLVGSVDSETSNVVTQARHLELLQKIHSCLLTALRLIKEDSSPEFIAFELQESVRAIHELLGKEFDEQVIDRIFKEFCLGK
jgi:tRNA modification GTPase